MVAGRRGWREGRWREGGVVVVVGEEVVMVVGEKEAWAWVWGVVVEKVVVVVRTCLFSMAKREGIVHLLAIETRVCGVGERAFVRCT